MDASIRGSIRVTGLLGGLLLAGAVGAAEIKVPTAGGFKPVVTALAPVFEQRTGHQLVIDNDTAGALSAKACDAAAAQAFLVLLAGPEARAVLKDKGMEAP